MTEAIAYTSLVISCLFGTIFMINFWLTAKMLKDLEEKIDLQAKSTDTFVQYCLLKIMEEAIEKEEYETAAKAKELLKNYEANKKISS